MVPPSIPVKVFISYSHDSEVHREKVLGLSERLRREGFCCEIDRYVNGTPEEGWPRWMQDKIDWANYVLVVCSPTYYVRFRGHDNGDGGKGADWEGAAITQEIYDSKSRTSKFIPVFFSPEDAGFMPEPLRPNTHYQLTSKEAYDRLKAALSGQAGVEPAPIGPNRIKPRTRGIPIIFSDETAPAQRRYEIDAIDRYAPENLIGREAEFKMLDDAWEKVSSGAPGRPHILVLRAMGGEGKTALTAKWLAQMAAKDWPGCDKAFAWSFYSQGSKETSAVSSDSFFKEALEFFGDKAMAASKAGGHEKGKRLAELAGQGGTLLILDGLEPMQHSPSGPAEIAGRLKDKGLLALLRGLAVSGQGLCIITTRYWVGDLNTYKGATVDEKPLLRLSTEAGVDLLKSFGLTLGTKKDFQVLVEDVRGHALTLRIMGIWLKKACNGDIRCREQVNFRRADDHVQGGHAFRAMAAYKKWMAGQGAEEARELSLLRLSSLFDRPAPWGCIEALLAPPVIPGLTDALEGLASSEIRFSLDTLEGTGLLTAAGDGAGRVMSLDVHPLVRTYFAERLKKETPKAWQAGQRRLYEFLCETTEEGDTPDLEALAPLYQAVAHGCQAGLVQEACDKVFFDRIRKGTEVYSIHKLGAFASDLGAIAWFFDSPWETPSAILSEAYQAWILNEAAFSLRSLGRLAEALAPMRAGLKMRIEQENWKNAAISASNISELKLVLGDVAGAVSHGEKAVEYADKSEDEFQRMGKRTTHADALHQAGKLEEALKLFETAEKMQAERQPSYPLLYSLPGFRYCDLLLGAAEQGGWAGESGGRNLAKVCAEVAERAGKTFEIAERNNWLLDMALDRLTQARAEVYQALLEKGTIPKEVLSHMNEAVAGLRRGGQQQYLPQGLLTRAWMRQGMGGAGNLPKAAEDLNEAFEIAAAGPMPLYLAEIHLFRARLFFKAAVYPWKSPAADIQEAERLIGKHGYKRRIPMLEALKEMVGKG